MLKADDLREFRKDVYYKDGNGITLETVQAALEMCANESGTPIAFYPDEVKSGGLLNSTIEKCLCLYHPEHRNDYFKIVIRVKPQGNYTFVSAKETGKSTLLGNQGSKEMLKDTLKHGSGAEKAGALVGAGLRRMIKGGADSQKLEEERNWYVIISDIFDEIIY